MQQSRRSTPYPSTWEIPLATATAVTLALVARGPRRADRGQRGHRHTAGRWTPRGGAVHRPARHPRRGCPRRAATRAGRSRRGRSTRRSPPPRSSPSWSSCWPSGRGCGRGAPAGSAAWPPAPRPHALLGPGRLRRVAPVVRPDLHRTRQAPTEPRGAHRRRVAPRGRPRTARRAAVGALGPHRRRHRPPRLRQDPRPAHPGPARRPRRRPGHPHQGRRPAAVHRRTAPPADRPCVVLDPFGLAPGLPELVWDPIAGCVDPMVAETPRQGVHRRHRQRRRRPRPGRRRRPVLRRRGRQGHPGLLPRRRPDRAHPRATSCAGSPTPSPPSEPTEILREHPHAAPVLARPAARGAARGRPHRRQHHHHRPAGPVPVLPGGTSAAAASPARDARPPNSPTSSRRRHHLPARPREPLRLRVTADDRRRRARPGHRAAPGRRSHRSGRLCPPLLACLDELPSTAPLPTLRTRMANERALGISFIWAAQTRAQLTQIFGEHEARALLGLTNTLVMFGGSKDVAFNQEISDLLGPVRVARTTYQHRPRRPVRHRRRHPHPHRRRSPPAPRTPRPRRRRERQTHHRQAAPAASTAGTGNACCATRRPPAADSPPPGPRTSRPEARATAALVEARRRGLATTDPRHGAVMTARPDP